MGKLQKLEFLDWEVHSNSK